MTTLTAPASLDAVARLNALAPETPSNIVPVTPGTLVKRRTLFELTGDALALHDLLTETGGDITEPSVAQAIDAWMKELDKGLHTKVDGYCILVRELEARAEARKAEAERLAKRAQVDENAARALKERLKVAFQMIGVEKIETDNFNVRVQKNGGKAPLEVTVAPEALPERFTVVERKVNNEAVRAALEAGEKVEGCRLLDRGVSLRIS